MLYAIVDIETTGGHASANGITEIAINVHDGNQVVQRYHTLINPGISIPLYITALTGIDNDMVAGAPAFEDVAEEIAGLLKDKTFVAHNVNFDYSFIKHQLAWCGYTLDCRKLCTVRLSRKLIPGHPSYSLGKLCKSLDIPLVNRHRATGDADATTILFEMLLGRDEGNIISGMVKKTSKEQQLPPNIAKEEVTSLPDAPGVYYFKDKKGKVIYVGKAVNIRKRVTSHFSGHTSSRQRQEFLRNIYKIDHVPCGTELMALVLEAAEIKRLWPENNRAMKRYEHKYDLFLFEDQGGFMRLAIDRHNKQYKSLQSFNNRLDGYNFLSRMIEQYGLCPKLCYLQKVSGPCSHVANASCAGACTGNEDYETYNTKVLAALENIRMSQPSFVLIDSGREAEEQSCLLVEHGRFYGMGYMSRSEDAVSTSEELKNYLQPYHSNNYIVNLILGYAERHPEKVMELS